uniref:Ig-like domain-containing protein n=1 Tax=Cyprinodon variegatus TaxID=28743 RepID=A0A3Q2E5U9_CYPVA
MLKPWADAVSKLNKVMHLNQPEMIVYPRDELIEDEENTLVCFINKFYPPALNISWTKNNKEVAVENPFFKIVSNSDGTFHVFSYLNFVPKQGDIYSCTVKHETLKSFFIFFDSNLRYESNHASKE